MAAVPTLKMAIFWIQVSYRGDTGG